MSRRTGKLKLTLLLVSSLTIMSIITISPALPQMAIAFSNVPNAAFLVKLVLTIPALMIAVFSPITGRLIDRHGRLKILRLSLALYAIAGTSGFFLNNLYLILLSRAVLGLAVGMSMTIVITLIADYFEGIERQKFVGIQIAFMSIGGILFTGLGGLLADVGWRYPFLIYLFSLLVLPLTILYLQEPAVAAKTNGMKTPIKVPSIIWMLFINTMLMWIIFFIIPVQIPFYLKAIGVEKNALIGAGIAISTAASAISSFFYSKIKGYFSFLFIFAMGYLLMAAGFSFIAVAHTYTLVVVAMMLSGFGMGMMIPNTNMWVMKIAPPEVRGKEIGKLATFWFLGQFLSPIVIFPVLKSLSLSSTFMLAAGFLLLLSLGFLIFHFSKAGKIAAQ
ncbi:MFS transporter [Ilyomonas limi]|uniref:MFS transporter n=1 Tax=Ilyomonas limi TaxID=2575867 RepID=A0A4U3L5Y4_9BACT|nr:MFS transporter [Ilyomonas limi]